jgi:uncharacterized protein YcnI
MRRSTTATLAAAGALGALTSSADAHVSLHPNAIPQGSFVTTNVRVPNEEDKATISSVRIKLPAGVLSAQGAPPAGWSFQAKTEKLAKPVKTDDGTISTEVTEVDFAGGKTPPGQFVNLPITLSVPDSSKRGDVLTFPTVQTYSDGTVARWIGPASADMPAPTVDITAAGGPVLDVTGGDAGPPAKLPAGVTGAPGSPASTTVVEKGRGNGLSIAALVVGALGLLAGGAAMLTRRRSA